MATADVSGTTLAHLIWASSRLSPPASRWTCSALRFPSSPTPNAKPSAALTPRPAHFTEEIIQAFYDGIYRKPETTFGNVEADVLAGKEPSARPENFCHVIRASAWPS
jgi:hypothetical protein